MKTWEESEFEVQQESIKKWAEKKLDKMLNRWYFRRMCKRMSRLASIIRGREVTAAIEFYDVKCEVQKDE